MTSTSGGLPLASVRPLTFKKPKPLLVYARLSLRPWGEVQHPSPGIVYDGQNGKINPLVLFCFAPLFGRNSFASEKSPHRLLDTNPHPVANATSGKKAVRCLLYGLFGDFSTA